MRCKLTLLLLMGLMAAQVRAEDSGDVLRGPINCSLTGAKFPGAVGQPLSVTYRGFMELTPDGSGRFVSGRMTTQAVGDTPVVRERRPCEFNLLSGTYTLNPDGTGRTATSWAYWEGGGSTMSDQLCSDNVFHPQRFQGLDLNNMRKDRNRVVEAFVVPVRPKGMMYWIGADEVGLTVAICATGK